MADKLTIDLEALVPPNAITTTLSFTTSASATSLLHRYEGDQAPLVLKGPSGEVEINIPQNRKLYLERLDASDWEISCLGYSF